MRRAIYKREYQKEKSENWLVQAVFRTFLVWQGQKDLNPRHAVLEWLYRARKAHRYTDFEPFLPLQNIIDAILMLLVILKKKYGEYRAKVLL